ncbi:uncharacterized protein LOC144478013 [Augochlora pura]
MLKNLKNNIDLDKEGIKVASVRESRKGDVIVSIRGDHKKVTGFSALVNSKIEGAKAWVGSDRQVSKVLHFRQIDGDANVEDVRNAILKQYPEANQERITVKALRPAAAGRQNATVIVSSALAEKLTKGRTLKIGWGKCSIKPREEITQCFRCREYGHIVKDCVGPDRSQLCRKCGEDHHTYNCKSTELKCIICQVKGHKEGSQQCPIYRKAILDSRRKRMSSQAISETEQNEPSDKGRDKVSTKDTDTIDVSIA